MRQIIRIFSLLLILGLCGTLTGVPASAQTAWHEDFSGYTEAGLPDGFMEQVASAAHSFSPVLGSFGKDSTDAALLVRAEQTSSAGDNQWFQFRHSAGISLEGARYYHISLELAMQGIFAQRWFNVKFSGAAEMKEKLLCISRNEDMEVMVEVGGNEIPAAVAFEQWNRLDFVIDTEDRTFDVYLNGETLGQAVDFELNQEDGALDGITELEIGAGQQYSSAAKLFPQSDTYYDNFSYEAVSERYVPGGFVPYHADTFEAYAGNGLPDGYITAGGDAAGAFRYGPAEDAAGGGTSFGVTSQENNVSSAQWAQVRRLIDANTVDHSYFLLSADLCFEGEYMNRWFNFQYSDGASLKDGSSNLFQFGRTEAGLTVTSAGEELQTGLQLGQWFHLDLLLSTANKAYSLYLDEEPMVENRKFQVASDIEIQKVTQIQIGLNQIWNAAVSKFSPTQNYIDNLCWGVYNTVPSRFRGGGTELPELELSADRVSVYEGEPVRFSAEVLSGAVTKVRYFVNGEPAATVKSAPYAWEFTPDAAGSYTVSASGYDFYGNSGQSGPLEITVARDERPRLAIEGLTDGHVYQPEDLSAVRILVTILKGGIRTAVLELDGERYCELERGENVIDLREIPYGYHTIRASLTDDSGAAAERELRIGVAKKTESVLQGYDFSDLGTDGGKYGADNAIGGFRKPVILSEAYGKSLAVGTTADNQLTADGWGPWIGFDTGLCTGLSVIEFDYYVDHLSNRFDFYLYDTAGKGVQMFSFGKNGLSAAGRPDAAFSAGQWHHLRMETDLVQKVFSLYLDRAPEPCVSNAEFLNLSSVAKVRLVTMLYGSEPSMIAIDNVECSTIVTTPMVDRVTSEHSAFQDRPDAADSTILCYLSAGFTERSVTYQGNVKVFQSGRELAVSRVRYDSGRTALSVELAEPLKPEGRYLVSVSGSALLADGTPLGRRMTGSFQAAPRILEMKDAKLEGGVFTAELVNHSGKELQAYLFVNRMKDGRLTGSEVYPYTLTGERTPISVTPRIEAGAEMELFVWDGIPGSYTLSDQVVKL